MMKRFLAIFLCLLVTAAPGCRTPVPSVSDAGTTQDPSDAGKNLRAFPFSFWKSSAKPTITSLNFFQADTAGGGQSDVITGTNFTGATSVTYDGTSASFTVNSSTQITATVPAHAAAAGKNVVVTTPAGVSTGGTAIFSWWTPAQITGIDCYLDSNKGVTTSAGSITTWVDQSAVGTSFSGGTAKPTQVASVFGSLPSAHYVGGTQYVAAASARTLASGLSWFFVGKTSNTYGAATNPNTNAPGTGVSNVGGSAWGGFGFDSGASCGLHFTMFDSAGGTAHGFSAGSGLNDGNVRLYGVTSDTTPNEKIYVATTQQGSTNSPVGGYSTTSMNYQSFGAGFNGGQSGLVADIGGFVVVSGIISGGDLTNLYAWARQRFGAL